MVQSGVVVRVVAGVRAPPILTDRRKSRSGVGLGFESVAEGGAKGWDLRCMSLNEPLVVGLAAGYVVRRVGLTGRDRGCLMSEFDLEDLLSRTGGDAELAGELVSCFAECADALVEQLRASVDDPERLASAAHAAKGAAANCAVVRAAELAAELEVLSKSGEDLEAARRGCEALLASIERAVADASEASRRLAERR
jgi:HPt (histidine-containing phosphotransfer) domain-containing protein